MQKSGRSMQRPYNGFKDYLVRPESEFGVGGADVAGGEGVAASGTLAERKRLQPSLRGCDGERL